MAPRIRDAVPSDAADCGRVIYTAFATLADHHRFPRDFPSVEVASGVAAMLLSHPGFLGVVAEADGQFLGCNFVDVRAPIAGIGPIAVDPAIQNKGVGRTLMQALIDRADARGAAGIRLVQAAYHNRSLCLYTRLGFQTRAPLSVMQGTKLDLRFTDYEVRPASQADIPACNALCRKVHGFDRGGELADSVGTGTAMVVEHLGHITGYATPVGFFAHAIAESNQDLKALIGAAPEFMGPGFLVPTGNHEIFAWCLDNGLRLVMQMTLMTIGLYNEPNGAWLPSILY
ncbi:MAG TPA: GNAT family N-acetyltransferase [Acetobacteraceae bacterium]